MLTLDVFTSSAFTGLELTAAVNKQDFLPSALGPVFEPKPVSQTTVMIEERGESLSLVQTSPRGGVPENRAENKRTVRSLIVPHLALQDRILADEVLAVRPFGRVGELETLQGKVNERNMVLRRAIELTWENMRLGAIKGTILDADATTIYDLFTEFGVTQETEVDFDLDNATPASGALRKQCSSVIRLVAKNLKGRWGPQVRVKAICGEAFWDDLIAHTEVVNTYLNWNQAQELRGQGAYESMSFGGIDFMEYRGTDDGSTVVVNTDKCHLFPANVPDLFHMYYAPADTIDFVNTPGLPFYALQAPDERFQKFVDLEVQSNPLPLCTLPKVLVQGKRT